MTKVYIVTQGSYSDYHIEAVFLDEAEAKKYVHMKNELMSYLDDECSIEEHEIASVPESVNVVVMFREDKSILGSWNNYRDKATGVASIKFRTWGNDLARIEYRVTLEVPSSYTKEQLEKVATDKLFQALAEGTVIDE